MFSSNIVREKYKINDGLESKHVVFEQETFSLNNFSCLQKSMFVKQRRLDLKMHNKSFKRIN